MNILNKFGITTLKQMERNTSQDFVNVKEIKDGVIITNDNRYINVIEIGSVNYQMLDEDEQFKLINSFKSFLKTGPDRFSIKCITTETDIDNYVDETVKALSKEKSSKCRKLGEIYINELKYNSKFDSAEKHYFLIYEYQPKSLYRKSSEEEIIGELKKEAISITSDFLKMGNTIRTKNENPTYSAAEFLYNHYNGSFIFAESFDQRVDRIAHDTGVINNINSEEDLPPVNIKNIVAPHSLDFTHADYTLINGEYNSYYYVEGNKFPNYAHPLGWLSALINSGYDINIYLRKEDTNEKLKSIRTRLRFTKLKMEDRNENQADYEDVADNIDALRFMKESLEINHDDFYYINVLITVKASTYEELIERTKELKNNALKMNFSVKPCHHLQEDAFLSSAPLNSIAPNIYNLSKHNITTEGLSSLYPFTSFSLCDKGGVYLGDYGSSMIMYNNFDRKYPNANISIYGASGFGKTFTLMTLTSRLRYMGVQNFILAPDKQDEFRRICSAVDGLFVNVTPSSNQHINIFDIWPVDSAANQAINGINGFEQSWVFNKIQNLKIWFKHLIPNLKTSEEILIEKALIRAYESRGIYANDNSSIYISGTDQKKDMPIPEDVLKELKKEKELNPEISVIFSQFVDGAAKNFNAQTNIDLNNKYIVFGLEFLQGNLQAPIMFIILEYIWSVAKSNKTTKKVIAIDEGWKLLDPKSPQIADFVVEIFKVIRGFGGAAIFATQSIADGFKGDGAYGNAILSCSHTNILAGMNSKDARLLQKELELTNDDINTITSFEKGTAMLCVGHTHVVAQISASDTEKDLFTTNPDDLRRMAIENMKNAQQL